MTVAAWGGDAPSPAVPEQKISSDIDSWVGILPSVVDLARNICGTDFVPASLQTTEKCTAAILYARELGLPPMAGLGGIHVIRGRAGTSAELMRALILRAGHELRISEMTSDRCVMKGRRRGEAEWTTISFTMNEANRAGYAQKNPQYKAIPAEMLLARCTGRIGRAMFADAISGLSVVEELQDADLADDDGVVAAPVVDSAAPGRTVRRRRVRERQPAGEPEPAGESQPADGQMAEEEAEYREWEKVFRRMLELLEAAGATAISEKLQLVSDAVQQPVTDPKKLSRGQLVTVCDALEARIQGGDAPDGEVSDGEVSDSDAAGDVEPVGRLRQRLVELGHTSRLAQLRHVRELVGRPILGISDLTDAEITDLLGRI